MKRITVLVLILILASIGCATKRLTAEEWSAAATATAREEAIDRLLEATATPVEKIVEVEKIVKETVVVEQVAPATPTDSDTNTTVEVADTNPSWTLYESEGGIPFEGASISVDVAPSEVEVITAGPASIAGINLPGGATRGSVVILLPADKVVHYTVTNLVTGSNWHGAYAMPFGSTVEESTWHALANERIKAMKEAPNCSLGQGCLKIDILVVNPEGVVAQWTE